MNEAVRALVVRHCETLQVEAKMIADSLDTPQPDWGTAFKLVHRIKGSSGSLGFPEIADLALRLETRLRALADREPTTQEVDAISILHRRLQRDVSCVAPDQSTLFHQ